MTLHRALVLALIALVTIAALVVILHIWGVIGDTVLMLRLVGTLAVLVLLVGFLLVVRDDFGGHPRLRDQNFLD